MNVCGCKQGCFHKSHPDLMPQMICKLGVEPMKMVTVKLAGEDLAWFKLLCKDMEYHAETVWVVQIGIDEEGLKFKVNGGTWTAGKGNRE
jgi:hypothetical protein